MLTTSKFASERFSLVREELRLKAPDCWAHVVRLCQSIPLNITVESFWQAGRGKPCWSNITTDIGKVIEADLSKSPDFDSHHIIASPLWDIEMIDQGPSWKKSTNFRMVGHSAKKFMDDLNTGGLKSYPWRLYAIRKFAQALTSGPALAMVNQLIVAKSDFGQLGAYPWAKEFSRHAGRGWGATTVLHMLTDLGLAVKPDIHLRRSAVRMGLLEPIIPSNLSVSEIDSRASELDPKIVTAIVNMARLVQPLAAPELPSVLREIDKTLMDWSKQGLLHPL